MGDAEILDPYCNPDSPIVVTFDQVTSAAYRIKSGIRNTECIKSEHLSNLLGMEIYIKKEFLQATGSFKERGARFAMMMMSPEMKSKGIVAASAGNHAQACCYHGLSLGIPVTVFMPESAPIMKIQKCRGYKGNVMVKGNNLKESKYLAQAYARDNGMMYLNGYDHAQVLAGQGTIGLEVWEQIPDLEAVVVPVGGGGLLAGISVAVKALNSNIMVIGVEPERAACLTGALKAGYPVEVPVGNTLADGLAVGKIGINSFATIRENMDKCVTVKEQFIALSILRLVEFEKSIVEGAGACTLAAILQGCLPELRGKKVCLILSGGNIDTTMLGRVLDRGLAADGRLVKVKVCVLDRVGGLGDLVNTISDIGVTIKEITHERAWQQQDLSSVEVKVVCECRDKEHSIQLRDTLTERYGELWFNGLPHPPGRDLGQSVFKAVSPQASVYEKDSEIQNIVDFQSAVPTQQGSLHPSQQIQPSFYPSQQLGESLHPSQLVGGSAHPSQQMGGSMQPSQQKRPCPCAGAGGGSVHPSQQMGGSEHPSQQMGGSLQPSQQKRPCPCAGGGGGSVHPSQQMGGSMHPSQQVGGSLHPSQQMGGSEHPSQQMGGSMHPSQQMGGSEHPSQQMGGSVHPSQQMGGSMHPSQQMGGSMHPSQQMGGSQHPSQQMGGSMQPSQQMGGSLHPSQQMGGSMHPSQQMGGSLHPSQQMGGSMHPSQQMGGSLHPSQQMGGSLHPSQQVCEPCGSTITGSVHPSQQMGGSLHPSQQMGGSMHPSQQMGGSMHPSQQPGGSLHPSQQTAASVQPSQQPSESVHPSQQQKPPCPCTGDGQMGGSMHPSQQMGGSLHPSQQPAQSLPGGSVHPSQKMGGSVHPSQQMGGSVHPSQQMGGSLHPSQQICEPCGSTIGSQQVEPPIVKVEQPPLQSLQPSVQSTGTQPVPVKTPLESKQTETNFDIKPFSSCRCKRRGDPGVYTNDR